MSALCHRTKSTEIFWFSHEENLPMVGYINSVMWLLIPWLLVLPGHDLPRMTLKGFCLRLPVQPVMEILSYYITVLFWAMIIAWRDFSHNVFYQLITPSAAYMRQWIVSALVQIMACGLYGAKPLSEPMLDYYQLDPWEESSVKF